MGEPLFFRSGLVALKDGVASYFRQANLDVEVRIGFTETTKQTNESPSGANRVVIVPCDDDGKSGEITQPSRGGARDLVDGNNVRVATVKPHRDWAQLLIVRVWAVDSQKPDDEDAQLEATITLLEQTVRAFHSALGVDNHALGLASIVWGKVKWTITPVEKSFGRELRAELTYKQPLFAEPIEVAYPTGTVTKDMQTQ